MRVVRLLLIAALVLLVGCSSGGDPAPSESDAAAASEAEPTEASEVASAEPTEAEEPTEEATEEPTEEEVASGGGSAAELFAPLPSGYRYTKLPKAAQQQLESQLGGVEGSPIIADFKAKAISKKATPVAVIFAVRFSDQATKADRRAFDAGVAAGVGGKSKPVTVGGQDVTFIKAQLPIYLYSGSDFTLMFFGTDQGNIEPVVAEVVQGVE